MVETSQKAEQIMKEEFNEEFYKIHYQNPKQNPMGKKGAPETQAQLLNKNKSGVNNHQSPKQTQNDSQNEQTVSFFLTDNQQQQQQQQPISNPISPVRNSLMEKLKRKVVMNIESGIYESFHKQPSQYRKMQEESVEKFNVAKQNIIKINGIIDDLELAQQEIFMDTIEMNQEQQQEDIRNIVKNYGKKLKQYLEKWNNNEDSKKIMDDPNLYKFRQETWGELINFEKKLKEEMNKMFVWQEKLKFFTITSIDWVKSKTSTYIEILEIALNDLKIDNNSKIERLQMTLEDLESRQFNVLEDKDFMKAAIEVEKEIFDTKDIQNFRQAMQQIGKFKVVLERLHKDYVQMASQSKSQKDELEQTIEINKKLQEQLEHQKNISDNLLDISINIVKSTVLYKDDEVQKTCRKTIADCENSKSDNLTQNISRFLSFIRMYPPQDLVTPIKKENEKFKLLIYCFIDYLQGTNQLIKYWVPQFEDTDDQYKSIIEGWHKNYLVTMFENESLQFLMRFRPNNVELPFKFQTPQHVLDRAKISSKKPTSDLFGFGNKEEESFNISGKKEDNNGNNNQDASGVGSVFHEAVQNDKEQVKTEVNNKTSGKSVRIVVPPNDSQTSNRNEINTAKPDLSKTNKQKSQRQLDKQISQPISAQKRKTSSQASLFKAKKLETAKIDTKRGSGIVEDSMSKASETFSPLKIDRGNSSDKKYFVTFPMIKEIKLQQQLIDVIQKEIINKLDSDILDKVISKFKQTTQVVQTQTSDIKIKDIKQLNDNEMKLLYQILNIQIPNKQPPTVISSNLTVDPQQLIRCMNEIMNSYFEIQKQDRSQQPQPSPYFILQEIFQARDQNINLNVDATLLFMHQNFRDDPMLFIHILKMLMKLNSISQISDHYYSDDIKQDIIDQYEIPNAEQNKILNGLVNQRRYLFQKLQKNNALAEDFNKFDQAVFRVTDLYDIIKEPIFQEGINQLGLYKMIKTFTKNVDHLNQENADIALDLVKYKLSNPNQLFDELLRKKLPQLQKSLQSESVQAFSGKSNYDILQALQNVNQAAQQFYQIKTPHDRQNMIGSAGIEDNGYSQYDLTLFAQQNSPKSNIDIIKSQSNFSDFANNIGNNQDHRNSEVSGGQKRKVEMIRRETLRTIQALQDFVRGQSQVVQHQKNSFLKLGSVNTISERSDSKQYQPQKSTGKFPKQPFSPLQSKSMSKKPSDNSLTIEESNESANSGDYNTERDMHRTQGSKVTNSSQPPQIIINNKKQSNAAILQQQAEFKSPNKKTTKSNSPEKRKAGHTPLHQQKSSFKLSEVDQIGDFSKVLDGKTTKNNNQYKYMNKSDLDISKQMEQFGGNLANATDDVETFKNKKEMELFGSPLAQLKEMDNNLFIQRMKEYDQEMEKIKKSQQSIKRNKFHHSQSVQRNIQQINSNEHIQLASLQENISILNKRIKKIEKKQGTQPNINIINSNLSFVDNSQLPEMVMKKLEKHGVKSQSQFRRHIQLQMTTNNRSFLDQARNLDRSLMETKSRVIGSSEEQKNMKRYLKLYPMSQAVSPSNTSNRERYIIDNYDQLARQFTLKKQNTIGQNTLYGNSTQQSEALNPKYSRRDFSDLKLQNHGFDLPTVNEIP